MVTQRRSRSLVVVQLAGGNDAMNTVIPYGDGLYYDWRKEVHIEQEKVLPIDDYLGFNPALTSMKYLWDENKMAIKKLLIKLDLTNLKQRHQVSLANLKNQILNQIQFLMHDKRLCINHLKLECQYQY